MLPFVSTSLADAAPFQPRRLVPEWAWWAALLPVTVGVAYLTLKSVQVTLTIVLVASTLAVHLRNRRAGLAVVWMLWFLLPGVRRVIGLSEGYGDADPLALAPFAATGVVAAVEVVRARLSRRAQTVLGLALAGFAFGLPIGLLRSPLPAGFAFFAYATSVLAFAAGYREPARSDLTLIRVLAFTLAPLAAYGILQKTVGLPEWDSVWLSSVDLLSAGSADDDTLRVFGSLNSPGTFAAILGLGLVGLLTASRFGALQLVSILVALAALALTLVRSVWVSAAIAMLSVLAIAPRALGWRFAIIGVAAVLAVPLGVGGGALGQSVGERATTLTDLSDDTSAQERVATPLQVIPQAVREPLGFGLGSVGEASRLGASTSALRATDNALLSIVAQSGPVGLILVLSAVGVGVSAAWRNARRRVGAGNDRLVLACLVLLLVLMLASDVFYGVTGAILWYLIGYAVHSRERHAAAFA